MDRVDIACAYSTFLLANLLMHDLLYEVYMREQ